MRDTMEMELLLLDFSVDPNQINAWLNADRKTRRQKLSPGAVRNRVMATGLHEVVGSERAAVDYRVHSEAIHVTPSWVMFPFLGKGHVAADDVMSIDAPFIEVSEHARRFGNTLLIVANRLSPGSEADEASHGPLPDFDLAHERTQEIISQFVAALRRVA